MWRGCSEVRIPNEEEENQHKSSEVTFYSLVVKFIALLP